MTAEQATMPEYFIFQRCRYYGFWPESECRSTAPFKMSCFTGSDLANANFRICYQVYNNVPNLNETPTEISGPIIEFMEIDQNSGFFLGDSKYIEGKPGDVIGKANMIKPKQGEVDLYISCELEDQREMDISIIYNLVLPFMPAIVLFFSSLIGDIVVPVGRPEGIKRSGTDFKYASNKTSNMVLLARPQIKSDALQHTIDSCALFSSNLNRTEHLYQP